MSRRKTKRLSRIIELFHKENFWTAAELSDALGVTEATIYRDVAALQQMGAHVKGVRGTGYFSDGSFDFAPSPRDTTISPYDEYVGQVRRALRKTKRRALWQRKWRLLVG